MSELTGVWFSGLCAGEEERDVYRWLERRVEPYPQNLRVPPLRPRQAAIKQRCLAVAEVVPNLRLNPDNPPPLLCQVTQGSGVRWAECKPDAEAGHYFEHLILVKRLRGALICFWNGARRDFHLILRHMAPYLCARGYQLSVIGPGTKIKALCIRKGKHVWTLTDIPTMLGLDKCTAEQFAFSVLGSTTTGSATLMQTWRAVSTYASSLFDAFGVALRPTIGSLAVAISQRYWPDDAWAWRPAPGLVAMCREGGAFRGGYVRSRRYSGPGHKADINSLYLRCLREPLPVQCALGPCVHDGAERPGVYLCRIRGPGAAPVYVARWSGWDRGMVRGMFGRGECLAFLPSAEFAGLRALGYRVEPGAGYVFTRWADLSGLCRAIESVLSAFPRSSPARVAAKKLANALYGQFAQGPHRTGITYSTEQPGDEWLPFVSDAGEEVDGVWTADKEVHRSHQQIHMAAHITAAGRSHLYVALSALHDAGVDCVAVDTDGIIVSADPRPILGDKPGAVGEWRYEGFDPRTVVGNTRFYAFGHTACASGTPEVDRTVVEIAWRDGRVRVRGKTLAPAWKRGPMWRESERVLVSR